MLEQGTRSEEFHRELGKYVIDKCDILITVGEASKYIHDEAKGFIIAKHFETKNEACSYLSLILKPNDAILVKESRKMKLEGVIKYLLELKK